MLCFIHAAGKRKLCQRDNCQTHLIHDLTESKRDCVFEIVLLLLTVITAENPGILYVLYQTCHFFHCSVRISLISRLYYKISYIHQHCVPVVDLCVLRVIKKKKGQKKAATSALKWPGCKGK